MNRVIHPHYITDEHGERISVVLPIRQWQNVLGELEELDKLIRLYDQLKVRNEPIANENTTDGSKNESSLTDLNQLLPVEKLLSSGSFDPDEEWKAYPIILLFTANGNVYRVKNQGFRSLRQLKESVDFEPEEECLYVKGVKYGDDYSEDELFELGYLVMAFKYGNVLKTEMGKYIPSRGSFKRKVTKVFDPELECVFMRCLVYDARLAVISNEGLMLVFNISSLMAHSTGRGRQVMNLKEGDTIRTMEEVSKVYIENPERYYRSTIPAVGSPI